MALIDNLVSYWKLDEASGNAADAHGSNTLTNNNSASYATGIINNGIDLEAGSSQYLSITDASQSGLDITGDLTMSAWIKRESDVSSHIMGKRDGGSGASGRAYVMYLDALSGTALDMNISNGTTDVWRGITYTFNTGTWYHVAITYNAAAGSGKFYVNGTQQGSTQTGYPTSITNNSQPFTIGREAVSGGLFDGVIDEVGIWNRELSAGEISSLYNSGSGLAYPLSEGTLYTSTFTETVTLTPSVIKTTTRTLSEVLTATASFIQTTARTLSETITATASLINTAARTLTEVITATASVIKTPTKLLIESGSSTSSGPLSPATTADDAAVGTVTWNNPNNAQASDATYSATGTITSASTTHYLKATNFGFSVPSAATITGILVEIQRKRTSFGIAAHIEDSAVRIVKSDGSIGTTNKADTVTNWPTTEAYASYGASNDLWGETWTYSDINDLDFGAVISASMPSTPDGNVASIDHIRITIYYTVPGLALTDTFSSGVTSGQTFTEAITLTAAFLVTTTRTLSEAVTATASFIQTTARTFAETISATASQINTTSRTFLESFTGTDTFIGNVLHSSTLSEVITAADTLLHTTTRVLSEALTATDTLLRNIGHNLIEAVSATDTLIREVGRVLSETLTTTATLLAHTARTFAETVSLSDTITGAKVAAAMLTETLTVTTTYFQTISRTLSDTVTASATAVLSSARTFSETVTNTDTLNRTIARLLSDTASLMDTVLKGGTRTLSEQATLTDLLTAARAYIRTYTETLVGTDTFVSRIFSRMKKGIAILTSRGDTTVLQSKNDVVPLRSTDDTTIL